MSSKPTTKTYIAVILPGVLTIFVIFLLIMPKVREGRVVNDSLPTSPTSVTTFEKCANAGNQIIGSSPRQCRHGDTTFIEKIGSTVGSVCEVSADCEVPMEYMIRSNCPYQPACREGQCVVVCPIWDHSPDPEESVSDASSCKLDSDCDCSQWDSYWKYPCECLDGQCASVVKTTQTSEKTTLYTNEEFGISFQYPSDWEIQDEQIVRVLTHNREVKDTVEKFENSVLLKMGRNESIFFDYESMSFEEYENYKQPNKSDDEKGVFEIDGVEIGGFEIKEITVANYPGKKYKEWGIELAGITYIVKKDGRFLEFITETGLSEEQMIGVEKIVNSFENKLYADKPE